MDIQFFLFTGIIIIKLKIRDNQNNCSFLVSRRLLIDLHFTEHFRYYIMGLVKMLL